MPNSKKPLKKLFACGLLMVAGGLTRLEAEIIFKDNVDNYPQVKANLQQAIATVYANDEVGYFRHLQDSPTDHMYVDVDSEYVRRYTDSNAHEAALFDGESTMFVREDFQASHYRSTYHEAWHRMQVDRAPNIYRILPPFYAVLINMLQEAGAVWYETQIYEKLNPSARAAQPAGMSEEAFRNLRFNQFFETFMRERTDYLDGAIDNFKDNYNVQESSASILLPSVFDKNAAKYNGNLEALNRLLQVYIDAYLPDEVKLNKTPEQLTEFFVPIIASHDLQREARGQVSVRRLNQILMNVAVEAAQKQTAALNKVIKPTPNLTIDTRERLDTLLAGLDGNPPRDTTTALTPQRMAELIRSSAYGAE
jgi:hypothetical protein